MERHGDMFCPGSSAFIAKALRVVWTGAKLKYPCEILFFFFNSCGDLKSMNSAKIENLYWEIVTWKVQSFLKIGGYLAQSQDSLCPAQQPRTDLISARPQKTHGHHLSECF